MRRLSTLALLTALTLAAAACGSSSDSGSSTATTTPPDKTIPPVTSPSVLELTVASSDLGDIVVDGEGRTLYLFTADTGTTSTCTGACATTWPALVGTVTAGPGITGTLGDTTRADGVSQVTLNGHPLYYYAADAAPGATSGQGIGGTWYVVDGAGNAVKTTAGASTSGY